MLYIISYEDRHNMPIFEEEKAGGGSIFFYSYREYVMSEPCEKFRWKVLGTNINIARLLFLPLHSTLDSNQ